MFDGLTSRGLALVLISAACGGASLFLLKRRAYRVARVLSAGAVASVVVAWGVAQWPYLLPESLTVSAGAAPEATLTTVVVVFGVAVVLVLPSLGLLYVLDQRGVVDAEEASVPAGRS